MRFRMILPLVALFIGTSFVACLSLAVSSDALASQLHSRLFREATERACVSGKLSAIGDASLSVDAEENQDLVTLRFLIDNMTTVNVRLKVGTPATVDDRIVAGINIVVQPSSWSR